MKKILLATSILAATTGFAAAEVTVTGTARAGLVHNYVDLNNNGTIDLAEIVNGPETRFSSRFRVIFTASGETDSGLSFGASVRNDQSGVGNDRNGDSTVYLSGAFGKVTFGDNDSAANVLVGDVSGVGYTGLSDWNELGYIGHTDTSVLYEYSAGAFSFALSSSQLQSDDAASIAVKYSTDTFAVALGYEDATADDQISLGASGTFGAATVKAVVADRDSWADTHYALSVDYAMDATTLTAFYADHGAVDAFGLGVAYDLGGGAAVNAGIVDNDLDTIAEVGVTMSF